MGVSRIRSRRGSLNLRKCRMLDSQSRMRVYLDHNATSPMSEAVRSVLADALEAHRGNASSPHLEGQASRLALERSRETIARALGVAPSWIVFTSGGSESNNAAIRGAVGAARRRGEAPRLVCSAVE